MNDWSSLRLTKTVSISSSGPIASLLVGDDAVYAADRNDDIVRLDRKTLRPVWRRPAQKFVPTLLIGDVLITKTIGSQLRALHIGTGKVIWTRDPFNSVALWKDQLLFSSGSALEVLDPSSGENIRSIPAPSVVAAGGRRCGNVLICGHPALTGFDLDQERVLWTHDIMAEMRALHAADEPGEMMGLACGSILGSIIATRGGMTFGCSLENGRIRWCAKIAVPHRIPNVHEGRVYVAWSERFIAIDEATGEVVYDVKHSDLEGNPKRSFAYHAKTGTVYGHTLAVPHESGHLAVFNLKDGSLPWLHIAKVPLWSSAEVDGRLLVGTGDGKLLVFES
jgi:outer membrane protein assembly factor BamB